MGQGAVSVERRCPTKDADLAPKMAKKVASPDTTKNEEDAATTEPNQTMPPPAEGQ